MMYARRQQYRHLARSGGYAISATVFLLVALTAPRTGGSALMAFTLLVAARLSWAARRSKRLAERCRVGADSERAVRSALNKLARSGWMVRNGVLWPGGGDVDHLVRSPNGLGFAIETRTRTYSQEHLRRTAAAARWAARRRRRYPHGVVPVLCLVRARRVESRYGDMVVVSLDRLLALLECLVMSSSHPVPSRDGRRWMKRQALRGAAGHLNRVRSGVADRDDG